MVLKTKCFTCLEVLVQIKVDQVVRSGDRQGIKVPRKSYQKGHENCHGSRKYVENMRASAVLL